MRIATYTHSHALLADTLRLQVEYAKAQTQTATGLKSETYHGLGKQAVQVLNLEADVRALETDNQVIETALQRLNAGYDAVGAVIDLLSAARAEVNTMSSGTYSATQIASLADEWAQDLEALLNAQHSGRYLFAGSAVSTAPVDLDDPAYLAATPPSVPDTTYYQGDDRAEALWLSDGYTKTFGMTARDPGIEMALRAVNLLRNNPGDETAHTEAYDLFGQAIDDLAEDRSRLSVEVTSLNNKSDQNVAVADQLGGILAGLKEADLAAVSTRIASLETQLEASCSVLTRLSRMSLVDYLA